MAARGRRVGLGRRIVGRTDDPPLPLAVRFDPELTACRGLEAGRLDDGRRADLGEALLVRRPAERWVPAERLVRDGVLCVLRGGERLTDPLERLEGGPARALAATSPRTATQANNAPPNTPRRPELMPISLSDLL